MPSTQLPNQSLKLLHTRFNTIVETKVEDPELRAALQREIAKFEKALPFWVPVCKGYVRQEQTLRSVYIMFGGINHGTLDYRRLQQYHDAYDEL